MKQEYQKMQESLLPNLEKREEMWERIVTESGKGRKQKQNAYLKMGLISSVVAAVVIFGLFLPQRGLADHIREMIQSVFAKGSDNITEDAQKDLYLDKDRHVKMQIKEMLSDGSCVYLGIRYRALDQEGKDFIFDPKWGSGKAVDNDRIFSVLYSQEYIANISGWSYNLEEIEEMRTEDERYFVFYFFESGDDFSFDAGEMHFQYAMPEATTGFQQGKIDVKSNLDRILYRVKKKDASQGAEQAIYLSISKISFRLLMPGADSLRGAAGAPEGCVKVVFTTKDGQKRVSCPMPSTSKDDLKKVECPVPGTPQDNSPMMKLIEGVENKGEYQMLCDIFENFYEPGIVAPSATLDHPEQIAALEIAGEPYELIREE